MPSNSLYRKLNGHGLFASLVMVPGNKTMGNIHYNALLYWTSSWLKY